MERRGVEGGNGNGNGSASASGSARFRSGPIRNMGAQSGYPGRRASSCAHSHNMKSGMLPDSSEHPGTPGAHPPHMGNGYFSFEATPEAAASYLFISTAAAYLPY